MSRIDMSDSGIGIISKMGEGNPGATSVIMGLMTGKADGIDPDNILGPLGVVMFLDTLEIYGADIWMLYKDICDQDFVTMLGLLRAVQLGYMNSSVITNEFKKPYARLDQDLIDEMMAKVRERLPRFQK